ncbi:MAG: HU family DNA-binding protein [Rubricoccaceae bacterium]
MEAVQERVATLTKKDVARRVAEITDEPLYRTEPWVQAVITALRELMIEADPEVRIELRDFGVFEVKKTRAKPKARNPKTNETVFIPARRKTHFKPSKLLREALQQPLAELGYSIPEGSADAAARD